MWEPIGPEMEAPGNLNPSQTNEFIQLNSVLSIAIGILSAVAGIWFLFLLITGAISYMQAGGDQSQIEDARKRITTGVIGIIVVIAAVFIADFVGFILGIDILNPGNFFLDLGGSL